MKEQSRKFLAILLTIGLLAPQAVFVLGDEYEASFDPDFILSDEELQNWQSMNRADIQAFLTERNSFLTNYHAEAVDGATRTASDIIYQSAKLYQINPKYLLVKLQKEQSLITDPSPAQKQLDWATGYGVCDACRLSDPAIQKHKGFGTQIDSAAGIMRWYYDNIYKESWIKTANKSYVIDNQIVHPTTNATGFLYTYTPHIHGNENFWKLWQLWFEQVYPNGTLITPTDSPTVYLIQDGAKRAFSSMTALITRFDPEMILTVPPSELSRYDDGPSISLPNYAILQNGSSYYLLDFDTIRPFANADTVRALGYNPDEIIEVNEADIAPYKIGRTITAGNATPLGRVVRVRENGSLYYLDERIYHPIADEHIAKTNFPHLTIETVPATALYDYTAGGNILFKNGTVFGVKGSNKIYVAEDGKKRHIASEDVFNGLGYKWNTIVWINQFAGLAHATGEPIYLRADRTEAQAPTSNEVVSHAPEEEAPEESPPDIESLMVRTPASEQSIIGAEFSTDVDAYLVADHETGQILAGKNIDTVRPMASFTKVMAGYRLLKDGLSVAKSTTYRASEHKAKYHYFKITEGEQILNQHLLYAMLISSLNTPAYMLASNVSKTPEEFVARMNQQARDWGLSKTQFNDPFGGEENVTTAREYLTIFTKSVFNREIKDILAMPSYAYTEIVDLDDNPDHHGPHSNALTRKDGLSFSIEASKTGYLYESGAVLAMLVKRNSDGKQFIVMTMGNPNAEDRFREPERLTEWALARF